MSLKLLHSIELVTVGGKYPAAICFAEGLGDIYHFGIKIAYPLHFIFCVRSMWLNDLRTFHDHNPYAPIFDRKVRSAPLG